MANSQSEKILANIQNGNENDPNERDNKLRNILYRIAGAGIVLVGSASYFFPETVSPYLNCVSLLFGALMVISNRLIQNAPILDSSQHD